MFIKKIELLVLPIMTISFLSNCSNVKYRVIFDSNGGTYVPTQEVDAYKCATKPIDPTKEPDPSKMVAYTFCEWQLNGERFDFATPIKENITLKASWDTDIIYHTVTFDSNGGSEVFPQTDIIYGHKAVEPENPTRSPSETFEYKFDSWHKLNEDGTVEQAAFDFDTPITKDITLKAEWTRSTRYYTVTFDSDGGSEVPSQTNIPYSGTATEPEKPTKPSNRFFDYHFNSWHKLKDDGTMETDDFNFVSTPITKNITLKAKWDERRLKYKVKAFNTDKLHFTYQGEPFPNDGVEVEAGSKFEFRMEAINNSSNSTTYKVPSVLEIKAGERQFIGKGYTITPDNESVAAKVTIDEQFIIDDITIKGDAIPVDHYQINLKLFGLKNADGWGSQCHRSYDENFVINLGKDDEYAWPDTPKDFVFSIDNHDNWLNPSELNPVTYDEANHQLIIKPQQAEIKSNVTIIGHSPIEALKWDDINNISIAGMSDLLFNVGDTKSITLKEDGNDQPFAHQLRIIDFNHNVDSADQQIGITFEFVNLLTDNNGDTIEKKWCNNDNNRGYAGGPIQKYLDGDFYEKVIPDSLRPYVKKAKVLSAKRNKDDWYPEDFKLVAHESYFFPLAGNECNEFKENDFPPCEKDLKKYAYYEYRLEADTRKKKPVGANDYKFYSTRTPKINKYILDEPNDVMYISKSGKLTFDADITTTHSFPMAPLFCI